MDPNSLSQAVTQLLLVFPDADPLFLKSAALHNLPAEGKRSDTKTAVEHVVQAVANKLVYLNHGEFPRVVWKRDASIGGAGLGEKRKAVENEMVDMAMVRNLALYVLRSFAFMPVHIFQYHRIRLHVMFPLTPIADLKRTILTHPHSPLFLSIPTLLSTPPPPTAPKTSFFASWFTWKRSPLTLERLSLPCLRPQDLFRSEEYIEALSARLGSQYPGVPKDVRARIVREAGGWEEARLAVSMWNSKPVTTFRLFSWFSSSTSSSAATEPSAPLPQDDELEEEIWISLLPERKAREEEDHKLARELNATWVDDDQKFSCGCCFDDVPFEEIAVCSSTTSAEPHFFCRECIRRQVEQHVYGAAPFMPYSEESGGMGVRCLSIEGCQASFSFQTLTRVLPPALLKALEERLADRAVDAVISNALTAGGRASGETVIQCPFCPYKELKDGRIWERAFPLFRRSSFRSRYRVRGGTAEGWIDDLTKACWSLTSLLLLAPIYVTATFVVAFAPEEFAEFFDPHRPSTSDPATKAAPMPHLYLLLEPVRTIVIAHRYLTSVAELIISARTGQRSIFQCRNGPSHSPRPAFGALAAFATSHSDLIVKVWGSNETSSALVAGEEGSCGKLSCLVCFKEWKEGVHRCFEDDDGLRLAMEKAMSEAIKRDCPSCGVAFVKTDGCNKVRPDWGLFSR